MTKLKLGTNFDFNLLYEIKNLNEKYKNENSSIYEIYGSERKMAFLTARPDFRLPDISRDHLEKYIKLSNDIGVIFNYTMNTINPGSKEEILNYKKELQEFIKYLQNIGCNRVTIANPVLLDIVREVSDDIEIDISTILHVETVTQIKYLHENYKIKKLCNNLTKNRSVKFLKNAAKYCNENDIEFELLANEFCGVGGQGYSTSCVYRQSCYGFHSNTHTKEEAESLNGYPMSYCMTSRKTDPYNWLRMRWIRPEDLHYYESIGIDNFKVTGRTGSTEYLLTMAESYLKKQWNGNLLSLWKPLETIYTGECENKFVHHTYIDNKKLDGFLNHWFNDENFDCANEVCGTTCLYCENFYKNKIKGI